VTQPARTGLGRRACGHGDTDDFLNWVTFPNFRDASMCRRAALGLEPTPQAVGEARHFVADTCRQWGIDDVIDEVTLAVSELVTNAVLHARTHIDVELCVSGGAMTVCVMDRDPRPPVVRPVRLDLLADLDASPSTGPDVDDRHPTTYVGSSGSVAGGRGLLIVDALADEWGVAELADGKEVWLTLPVQWTHAQECGCDPHQGGRPGHGCVHQQGPWDAVDVGHAQ
jgi:hypothetical protein